jgi:taurine transport system permease protein
LRWYQSPKHGALSLFQNRTAQPPPGEAVAMPAHRRLASAAWFFAPFAVLLVLWATLVPYFNVNPRLFPHLDAVVQAGIDGIRDGSLINHVGASLMRVAVGTVLALIAAIPVGIAMGVSPVVSTFLTPVLRFFSVLAGIAWIPIATLWFGYGFGAITFVIFNAVFFIVTYNTLLGVSTIPMAVRNAAASLGAGRWSMLTEVLLPGALPNIVTGIRTGLGFAWRGLIAAEMIATNVGLGYMLFVARDFYRTEVIVLGMIVIGVLWLLLDRLLLAPLERATVERWGMVQRA